MRRALRFFLDLIRLGDSDIWSEEFAARRFWRSNGAKISAAVTVPKPGNERLTLSLQRPIEGADVFAGKLIPLARTDIARRGGKHRTHLTLSIEEAMQLHRVLGTALKDAKKKRRFYEFTVMVAEYIHYSMRLHTKASMVPRKVRV